MSFHIDVVHECVNLATHYSSVHSQTQSIILALLSQYAVGNGLLPGRAGPLGSVPGYDAPNRFVTGPSRRRKNGN